MTHATILPRPRRRIRTKRIGQLVLIYAFGVGAVFVTMTPVLWLLATAFRQPVEIISPQFHLLPQRPTFSNFVDVFTRYHIAPYVVNSIIIALGTVFTNLLIGPSAAYALARYKFRGQGAFMVMIIFFRMLPLFAVIVPLFIIFSRIGLLNTHAGLIIAQTAFKLPLTIWLLRSFFLGVSQEIEESAKIDGCSTLGVLFRISLPLIQPGLAAAAVLTFLQTWNDLTVTLVLSSTTATATLPLGLSKFVQEFGVAWGPMSAAGVLMFIPSLLFIFVAERYLIQGLAVGAVKE